MSESKFRKSLEVRANQLGFDTCKVTNAELPQVVQDRLIQAIGKNHHGTMAWMERTAARRKSPVAMWPEANSTILLGMNYGPDSNPLENLDRNQQATISVYARNRDYHDVVKGKLKTLASWIVSRHKANVKVFVDTAPLMEKPLAEQAGLGWQGKHTNLVSREFGSWLFLGAILTDAKLDPDIPEKDHCGSCRACIDVCPTNAFPAPYQLDARRCISYLTIEHHGPIPHEFRERMGNRIYGCDDCLAVCPWNKYAQQTRETKLAARDDLQAPDLADLAGLDDTAFRKKFSGSPVKRIGRDKFIRNVLIAIGNSGAKELLVRVKPHLEDPNQLVRGAAVWALGRLEDPGRYADMRGQALKSEADQDVRREWNIN